jgi:DNA-binding MarR family transcriptional regulator
MAAMNDAAADPASLKLKPEDTELDASALHHLAGFAAALASARLKKCFKQAIEPLGLKVVEFSILVLVANNASVNQKQLGQAVDLSPPHLAVTLDRMVERGWVLRQRCTADRRAQLIRITAAGHTLAQQAHQLSLSMEAPALAMLSAAETALLIELLHRVAQGQTRTRQGRTELR